MKNNFKSGLLASLLLHGCLMALIFWGGWTPSAPPLSPHLPPIPVDLVTLAPVPKAPKPAPQPAPKPVPAPVVPTPQPKPVPSKPDQKPMPSEPPKPKPQADEKKTPEAKAPEKPAPKPVSALKPATMPVPAPPKKADPKVAPKKPQPKAQHPSTPKPQTKPTQTKPTQNKPAQDKPAQDKPKPAPAKTLDSLLKNLQKDASPASNAPTDPKSKTREAAAQIDQTLAPSVLDGLRQQLKECWNVPVGARHAQDLVIVVRAEIGPDGIVRRATLLPQKGSTQNPFYQAAGEAALRALKHPKCVPLKLPLRQHALWKEMELVFNPKDIQ